MEYDMADHQIALRNWPVSLFLRPTSMKFNMGRGWKRSYGSCVRPNSMSPRPSPTLDRQQLGGAGWDLQVLVQLSPCCKCIWSQKWWVLVAFWRSWQDQRNPRKKWWSLLEKLPRQWFIILLSCLILHAGGVPFMSIWHHKTWKC